MTRVLCERARILRVHGIGAEVIITRCSGAISPRRVAGRDAFGELPHFDGYTAARRRNAAHYTERLAVLPGVRMARAEIVVRAADECEGTRAWCCDLLPAQRPYLESIHAAGDRGGQRDAPA